MNPRQGDLFLYGTESLICPINRKGSWVGCLGWQRGWARTFFLSNFFPFQPFSFISDKNRLMNVPNSYFFLNISKNRLKWIKDPNLHDSQDFYYFSPGFYDSTVSLCHGIIFNPTTLVLIHILRSSPKAAIFAGLQ